MAGRPRKPTKMLKLQGTYREDMNGVRADEEFPANSPRVKTGTTAQWARDFIMSNIPEFVLSRCDALQLEQLADCWEHYCEARAQQNWTKMRQAAELFNRLASPFGLNPAARAKLSMPGNKPSKNAEIREKYLA